MTMDSPTGKSFESTLQELRANALERLSADLPEADSDRNEVIRGSGPVERVSVGQENPQVQQIKQTFGDKTNVCASEIQSRANDAVSELEISGEPGVQNFIASIQSLNSRLLEQMNKNIDAAYDDAISLGQKQPSLQQEIMTAANLILQVADQVTQTLKEMLAKVSSKIRDIINKILGPVIEIFARTEQKVSAFISTLF